MHEQLLHEIKAILDQHSKPGIFYPIADAVEAIVKVINKGAEKYDANGWMQGIKFDPKNNAASKTRHTMSDSLGIIFDPETGLYHLEHDVSRGVMALHCRKRGLSGFDKPHVSIFDEQNI